MLKVTAHPIPGYNARTVHNAQVGHVTVAFAVDFSSGGELLTRSAAGDRYMAVLLPPLARNTVLDAATPARKLLDRLAQSTDGRIVNIAGNSLRRLHANGWRQELCDAYVYRVLALVHRHTPIQKIVSGGQTGADLSGAIAAVVLGIDTEITGPADLRQRPLQGPDLPRTKQEIEAMVHEGAARLRATIEARQARQQAAVVPVSDEAAPVP